MPMFYSASLAWFSCPSSVMGRYVMAPAPKISQLSVPSKQQSWAAGPRSPHVARPRAAQWMGQEV